MLKGVLLCYSNTGNTRLACEYVKARISRAAFDLIDIVRNDIDSLAPYDVAGFAFFTDALSPPRLFLQRVAALRGTQGKPVFSLNTYGCLTGNSARIMCRALQRQNMRVIGAHSLHMPQSYPPMIAAGHAFADSPSGSELLAFGAFIARLNFALGVMECGKQAPAARAAVRFPGMLLPSFAGALAELAFGRARMHADPSLCQRCGVCAAACPAGAISLMPAAVFDGDRCERCWSCYNHCPHRAVRTGRYAGQGQYPHPSEDCVRRLTPPAVPR